MAMVQIQNGSVVELVAGDHFAIKLRDGTILQLEQTQDDFSLTRADNTVAYTCPVSEHAKEQEGYTYNVNTRNWTSHNVKTGQN